MNREQLRIFEDPTQTATAFGQYLMSKLDGSSDFHCALSGGSTPKLLFEYLADDYQAKKVWSKLHVYWGDERCVPPEDDDSNYKMTNDLLLSKVNVPAQNVHRVRGEEDPNVEADRYSKELEDNIPTVNGLPLFDLIILGMGDDGHTASIFPHEIELLKSERLCAVANHPVSGQQRITLTGQVINTAKEVVFLVTGEGKKERIVEIFNKEGKWKEYPAFYIEPISGNLLWFVDKAAVSGLQD